MANHNRMRLSETMKSSNYYVLDIILLIFILRLSILYARFTLCSMVIGGYGVATGGPLAWGLCYNKEMSPSQSYCDDYFKLTYPCAPGADYYGRGAIPIYW